MNVSLHNISDGGMMILKDGKVETPLVHIRFLGDFVALDPALKQSIGEGAYASLIKAVALKEKAAAERAAIEAAKSKGPTPRKLSNRHKKR